MIRHLLTGLVAVLLPLAAALADNATNVLVRVGTHERFGRVVFDLPARTGYRLSQQGQTVLIQFDGELLIGSTTAVPRNVLGIVGGVSQAEIVVAPNTVLRDARQGNRVVIDVVDRDAADLPAAPRPVARAPAAKPAPEAAPTTPAATPAPEAAGPPPPPLSPPAVAPRPAAAAPPAVAPPATVPTPIAAPPQAAASRSTPPPAAVPTQAAAPAAEQPAPPPPGQETATPPRPAADAPVPPPAERVEAAPAAAVQTASPAAGLGPTGEAEANESELVIPSGSQLGLAVLRRGDTGLIVLDQPRPIDLAALRDDPIFGAATVQSQSTATLIRVHLDPGTALSAVRSPDAWRIIVAPHEPMLRPIQATVADDRMLLPAALPGSVVTVTDPDTGGTLLIGTQRREGQGVPAQRRTPEFTLLPTWQGVAVEAHAETVTLRPTSQGFVLAGNLALSPQTDIADQLVSAIGLTRQFDFANQPSDVLLQRLRRQVADDAATPPLARGPRRQAVARTMISLGLGVEAGSVLRMAAADDPHEAVSSVNAALTGIAALLAHRPQEAGGLIDPRLQASDDITLWRAVRLAQLQPGSPAAAAMFTATLPLLLAYPPEMRERMLPLVAETLVAGGEPAAAAALLKARKDDTTLDLARAMLAEAQGDTAGALASYDRLAQSPDRSVHVRAAVRAIEVRLATGALNTGQAAERLESLLYAWRGDRIERALRERLAELKTRVGAWRSALGLLRENEALFPDDKAAIHAGLVDLFAALLRDDTADTLPPLELVAIAEENADLLPSGADGEALQARLADRLARLDLPKRAGPVLEKLMQAAGSAASRAGFGTRLASLRLREGDAAGALAALDASAGADLPTDLVERRTLLVSAANARRGDADRALGILGGLASPAANEARASILERANDWPGAHRALAAYAAAVIPPNGRLDDAQRRILLRLATAAARAGDEAALGELRQRETARMETGPLADMFRLLTAQQVRSVADLKRSGQETALARELPGQLKALQPGARQPP